MTLKELIFKHRCFVDVYINDEWVELDDMNGTSDGFYQLLKPGCPQFSPIANVRQEFNGDLFIPDITGKEYKIKVCQGKVIEETK